MSLKVAVRRNCDAVLAGGGAAGGDEHGGHERSDGTGRKKPVESSQSHSKPFLNVRGQPVKWKAGGWQNARHLKDLSHLVNRLDSG